MFRVLPVARQASSKGNQGLIRISRRRLVTETTDPAATLLKGRKRILPRIIFYSTVATATFYVGSAFVAFNNLSYHAFFQHHVPFAPAILQYGEDHGWDDLSIADVVVKTYDGVSGAYSYVRKQLGFSADETPVKAKVKDPSQAKLSKAAAEKKATEVKERVQKAVDALKTDIKSTPDADHDQSVKLSRPQSIQFTHGVEELVLQAEAALQGKPFEKSQPPSTQPEASITHAHDQPTPTTREISEPQATSDSSETESTEVPLKNVYTVPLPLGHEPPPGFTRPDPFKPPKLLAQGEPLPLVAPAIEELHSSEPILTHLAGTIDSLASFVNANPTAANKARDVLEVAKSDLSELAQNFELLREAEKVKLEQSLDEHTREYTLKLLELELQAQDKLESQATDFHVFLEEEKARFAKAYREKLEQELRTQSDIINERLKEEVVAQGIELQRRWIREIKIRVEEERGGRLAKLDELAANMKRLERVALDNSTYLDENLRVHALWSALRAVNNAVDAPVRRPFRDELRVLRHAAAARDDTVVGAVLDALDAGDAPDVGVEPLADLASWFTTSVAPAVSRVALVPDDGAGVLAHVASHVLSAFAFRRHGLVPGNDVLSVLARAEYHLNEKDLDSATRELNQLRGTAGTLLKDWLDAARRRLEVQQAIDVLHTQATLASLLVAQEL
ncbi:mitochondrial inner membrane protein Mitofilin [Russula earlei]|uniref:Mitochondrial inner membrane protein Mitofilin n=1 Tax=Russula earlei TaxID=71964 RepID=A0ACC0UEQ1_9AGAM|nr:mitochondrial inner membrane protein Mitofilin [Russula earlei]